MKELLKIDISSKEQIEESICEIGELFIEYTGSKEYEILDKYDDEKFMYEKFGIEVNEDYFHFEFVEGIENYGFYKFVGATCENFNIDIIIEKYNYIFLIGGNKIKEDLINSLVEIEMDIDNHDDFEDFDELAFYLSNINKDSYVTDYLPKFLGYGYTKDEYIEISNRVKELIMNMMF
ncbi:MAG: hypothetical protein E6X49_22995 [Leclercia adecarboxylata]|nr:hypothetical protein [Leclercia adecarboxylata]